MDQAQPGHAQRGQRRLLEHAADPEQREHAQALRVELGQHERDVRGQRADLRGELGRDLGAPQAVEAGLDRQVVAARLGRLIVHRDRVLRDVPQADEPPGRGRLQLPDRRRGGLDGQPPVDRGVVADARPGEIGEHDRDRRRGRPARALARGEQDDHPGGGHHRPLDHRRAADHPARRGIGGRRRVAAERHGDGVADQIPGRARAGDRVEQRESQQRRRDGDERPAALQHLVQPPAGQQSQTEQIQHREPGVVPAREHRQMRDDLEQRRDPEHHQHAGQPGHRRGHALARRPQDQCRGGEHQRQRAAVERPGEQEEVQRRLGRLAPLERDEDPERELQRRLDRARRARPLVEVGRAQQQLAERQQHERGQRRSPGHPADGEQRRPPRRRRAAQAQQGEQRDREQQVKARLRVPGQELHGDDQRQPGRAARPRTAQHPLGGHQRPRDQCPHAGVRIADPRDQPQVEAVHDPTEERPRPAHPQRPAEQERPERRRPQLQRGDQRQGLERVHEQRRQVERRERRGLGVGEERASRGDPRVPQRDVREAALDRAQERLHLLRGVAELGVGRALQLRRPRGRPGRLEPQRVRVGEHLAGQQPRRDERQRQRRQQQRRAQHGALPHRRLHAATASPAAASSETIQPIRQLSGR